MKKRVKKRAVHKWLIDIARHPVYFMTHNVTKRDDDELNKLLDIIKRKNVPLWDDKDKDVKAYYDKLNTTRYSFWSYLFY